MKRWGRGAFALAQSIAMLGTIFGLSCERLSASTVPIAIYNTGVDDSGTFLSTGDVDPHYTLTMGDAYVAYGATLAEATGQSLPLGWPIGDRYATSGSAQWIAPNADIVSLRGTDSYTYTTTFDLTGIDPNTVSLSGMYSVDNYSGGIYLNGVLLPGTSSTDIFQYTYLTSFDITSGFVAGLNTLSFVVDNSPAFVTVDSPQNPTGLLVEISGDGDPMSAMPEPAVIWLVGAGIAGIVIQRRRARSRG